MRLLAAVLLLFTASIVGAQTEPPLVYVPIQIIVVDNPGCPACQKFNAEVGQERYDQSEYASRAFMSYLTMGQRPPRWFGPAYKEERIKKIQYTPTFLFLVHNNDGVMREVGRFVGYRNPEWFYSKVEEILQLIEPHLEGGIFQEGDGEQKYWDKSHSEVENFNRGRSI